MKSESRRIEVILVDESKTASPTTLQKLESVAKTLSVIAIPVVLAIGGWYIQNAISSRSVQQAYVELAVSVLTAGKNEVDPDLRQWALTLLNSYSIVPMKPGVAEKLASRGVKLPEAPYMNFGGTKWSVPLQGATTFELAKGSERYGIRLIDCESESCDFEMYSGVPGQSEKFSLKAGESKRVRYHYGGPVREFDIELVHMALSRLGFVVSVRVRDWGHPFGTP